MKTIDISNKNIIYKAPELGNEVLPANTEFSHYSLDIQGTKGKFKVGDILPTTNSNLTSLNLFTITSPTDYTITFSDKSLGIQDTKVKKNSEYILPEYPTNGKYKDDFVAWNVGNAGDKYVVYSDIVVSAVYKNGFVAKEDSDTPPVTPPVTPPKQPVAFTLTPASAGDIEAGKSKDITIGGLTQDATIKVTSANSDIATAKLAGDKITITAVKEGNFTINVVGSKADMTDTTKKVTGKVTAKPEPAPQPVAFTLAPANAGDIEVGALKEVSVNGLTDGANIEATSANANVATVAVKGNKVSITAVKEGNFTINVVGKKAGMVDTTKKVTGKVIAKPEPAPNPDPVTPEGQ